MLVQRDSRSIFIMTRGITLEEFSASLGSPWKPVVPPKQQVSLHGDHHAILWKPAAVAQRENLMNSSSAAAAAAATDVMLNVPESNYFCFQDSKSSPKKGRVEVANDSYHKRPAIDANVVAAAASTSQNHRKSPAFNDSTNSVLALQSLNAQKLHGSYADALGNFNNNLVASSTPVMFCGGKDLTRKSRADNRFVPHCFSDSGNKQQQQSVDPDMTILAACHGLTPRRYFNLKKGRERAIWKQFNPKVFANTMSTLFGRQSNSSGKKGPKKYKKLDAIADLTSLCNTSLDEMKKFRVPTTQAKLGIGEATPHTLEWHVMERLHAPKASEKELKLRHISRCWHQECNRSMYIQERLTNSLNNKYKREYTNGKLGSLERCKHDDFKAEVGQVLKRSATAGALQLPILKLKRELVKECVDEVFGEGMGEEYIRLEEYYLGLASKNVSLDVKNPDEVKKLALEVAREYGDVHNVVGYMLEQLRMEEFCKETNS
ncbi:unnamed protein product [Sphagnum compactum]